MIAKSENLADFGFNFAKVAIILDSEKKFVLAPMDAQYMPYIERWQKKIEKIKISLILDNSLLHFTLLYFPQTKPS